MRIDRIQIDAYGRLKNWHEGDLKDEGVVVLLGGNESGKSSTLDFIESMLFGFKPGRAAEHAYFPWDGGRCGGSISIDTDDGESLVLRRDLRDRAQAWLSLGDEERPIPNEALLKSWPSRASFERVFSLDQDELARPTAAVWRELESRLASGWDGPAFRDPADAVSQLRQEAQRLWRPDRRGRPTASRLVERLDRLQSHRRQALEDRGRYDSLSKELENLALRLRGAQKRKRRLENWLAESEIRRPLDRMRKQLRERWSEMKALSEELESLNSKSSDILPPAESAPLPWLPWALICLGGLGLSAMGWIHPVVILLLLMVVAGLLLHRSRREKQIRAVELKSERRAKATRLQDQLGREAQALREGRAEVEGIEAGLSANHERESDRPDDSDLHEEIASMTAQINRTLKEQGRGDSELRRLRGGLSLDDLDGEVESIKDDLREVRRQRDRRVLAAAIIERVRRELGDGLSPRFVGRASKLFATLTRGRYVGLFAIEEGGRPRLYLRPSKNSEPIPAKHPLSRGTAQQAWLAFRLALVDDLDDSEDRLPLLLDEVFAEWDRTRIDGAAEVLQEMSASRQIFIATARPELASAFRRRGAKVIYLNTDFEAEA